MHRINSGIGSDYGGSSAGFYAGIQMKQSLSFFILIALVTALAAEEPPLWYSNKNVIYPETVFISAVGSGRSAAAAKEDALTQLALYFNARISVNTATEYSISQRNSSVNSNRSASGSTVVVSETELPAVQFTEPFYNESRYNWAVCAYISKKTAAEVCNGNLQNGISEVQSLLAASERLGGFSGFSAAAKAVDRAESLLRDGEMLCIVSPESRDSMEQVFDLMETSRRRFDTMKRQMTFRVAVVNDPAGTFATVLQELLSSNGFICSAGNARYTVQSDISTAESRNQVGVFVRPGIVISVLENNGSGTVLASYSKQYPKYGHVNLDGAYAKAYAEIEKDLRLHFMELFY